MRKFITVLGVAVILLAVLLCPGCKKRETLAPSGEEEIVGTSFPAGDEIVLPEPPPLEFQEPENKEVFHDIHFAFDRAEVRAIDRPTLQGIAAYLDANSDVYLLIEGHCDERGTSEYNLALGERRALSTRAFLVGLGVDGQRIVTISLGEEDPANPGHNEATWAENRRAHFKVGTKDTEAPKVVE
jgi:peptidoglycan-associated lipoprotein